MTFVVAREDDEGARFSFLFLIFFLSFNGEYTERLGETSKHGRVWLLPVCTFAGTECILSFRANNTGKIMAIVGIRGVDTNSQHKKMELQIHVATVNDDETRTTRCGGRKASVASTVAVNHQAQGKYGNTSEVVSQRERTPLEKEN